MRSRGQVLLRLSLAAMLWLALAASAADTAQQDGVSSAKPADGSAAALQAAPGTRAIIEVFVREGCPHCVAAEAFLVQLQRERPGLEVRFHRVDVDAAARARLGTLFRAVGAWPPGVPAFVVGTRLVIGFDDPAHSGRELRALLDAVDPTGAVDAPGAPGVPGAVRSAEPHDATSGLPSVSRLGLPLFTLALGLLDGFNPCAMWVLLFLLAMLVRLRDRRRMALIAGTFVITSGVVYYAFMAAWLNVFLAVGLSGPVRVGLGVLALAVGAFNVKDFAAPGLGPSLSIPGSARPGLVARMARLRDAQALPAMLLGVVTLALAVNVVELLCTAGLPAVFTAVLAQQGLSPAAHYAYLLLYILGYVADDSLMVGLAIFALGSGKLGERGGRLLKLLSGVVMLTLGAILLLRPHWLF